MPKTFRRTTTKPLKKFVRTPLPKTTQAPRHILQYRSTHAAKISAWYDMRDLHDEELMEFQDLNAARDTAFRLAAAGKLVWRVLTVHEEV